MKETMLGYTDGAEFRANNGYNQTQRLFAMLGLSDEVENRTPTVGVNVAHLARMKSVQTLGAELTGKPVASTILGISTAEGPKDFETLLHSLGATHVATTAIDISDGIFDRIQNSGMDKVSCLLRDARETGLSAGSQDVVLRDHIGNCCPPEIDRAINQEAVRILKPGGIAVVNITTSDLLSQSQGRSVIPFERLRLELGDEVLRGLQTGVYDLEEAALMFPGLQLDALKGAIAEIEPDGSFVVFGEDKQGHGEWFRKLEDHRMTWERDGFDVLEIATRQGTDSHEPPLQCMRHNVVLRKRVTSLQDKL